MCTPASVSACACVFVIVPFSLAAGAATPGQAGGESERGVGGGGVGGGRRLEKQYGICVCLWPR